MYERTSDGGPIPDSPSVPSDALTGQECHGAIDEATGEYKYYMAGNPG